MERREFCKLTGVATAVGMMGHLSACHQAEPTPEPDLATRLRALLDEGVPRLLARQERDAKHRWFGGVKNAYGIHTPGGAAGLLSQFSAVFVSPGSPYFHSPEILDAMELAMDYLLRVQHDDGTIDLLSTNFHSTPDTGFVAEPLTLAFTILNRSDERGTIALQGKLKNFLVEAGRAMAIGGIHTPNHRWVVSMALSRINALFPDQAMVHRVDQWLAENIDIDPDGQYTEQSTSVYSPLTNRCLITIARLLNRPELLEPVRKNLEMTLYYIHPNGEVVTEASGRQDQFRVAFPDRYYYPYRYLAIRDRNGLFSAMAEQIESSSFSRLAGNYIYFLEDQFLLSDPPPPEPLPRNYYRHFMHSNLVRIRREEVDATILGDNHTFFTFFKNAAALQAVQLSMAFFGKGEFKSEQVRKEGDAFVLEWTLTKGYYQLFPQDQLPTDGDWEKMPRDERPLSEVQTLTARVVVIEQQGEFVLTFEIEGTDDVPVAIELAFRKGGTLTNVMAAPHVESAYLFREEKGTYSFGEDVITFGPGRADHSWTQLRGGLPKKPGMSVYLTGYTPFRHKLMIS